MSVAPGLPIAAVKVSAATGPPRLTITGPRHTHIAATRTRTSPDVVVLLDKPERTTYVIIRSPRGGRWHIHADRPIRTVGAARGLPRPHITATLTRREKKETLRYKFTRIPGQSVRLVEHASGIEHDLGLITRPHGTLSFTPIAGMPTSRTIVAHITQNHLPRTTITVAHYRVR